MGKKPDFVVMNFFLGYCRAMQNGWSDLADAILQMLYAHGFDVKKIQGKWCLVDYENGGDGK